MAVRIHCPDDFWPGCHRRTVWSNVAILRICWICCRTSRHSGKPEPLLCCTYSRITSAHWQKCRSLLKNFILMSQDNTEVLKEELCSFEFSNFLGIKQNTVSGFEFLAVVTVKITVSWVIMPCSLDRDWCFTEILDFFQTTWHYNSSEHSILLENMEKVSDLMACIKRSQLEHHLQSCRHLKI